MLNVGPVNTKKFKEAQKAQMFSCFALGPFVVLPEPGDDRETFATGHWQHFVKSV